MPKMKTKSSAKKRFKVTGSERLKEHAFKVTS
jgi:ribosomal protein L35